MLGLGEADVEDFCAELNRLLQQPYSKQDSA